MGQGLVRRIVRSRIGRGLLATFAAGILLLAWMYIVATSDPVVRRTTLAVPQLSGPVRLVLIADVHVAGPDMPRSRVQRIVQQVNALKPDIILIAGDLVSDKSFA